MSHEGLPEIVIIRERAGTEGGKISIIIPPDVICSDTDTFISGQLMR